MDRSIKRCGSRAPYPEQRRDIAHDHAEPPEGRVIWQRSDRADPRAVAIADRHYNRQKPGTPQFVPPGRCLVLVTDCAVWVTSWPFAEYVKHRWPGAWVNSCFRREGGPLASEMIREAVAATRWRWPDTPALGLVSFIDPDEVRPKRDPGYCYIMAGFEYDGETVGGLIAVRIRPENMPEPEEPLAGPLFA
jgi:hypothetical protein